MKSQRKHGDGGTVADGSRGNADGLPGLRVAVWNVQACKGRSGDDSNSGNQTIFGRDVGKAHQSAARNARSDSED